MRILTDDEVGAIGGGLRLLDDIAAEIGKEVAEFVNDAEYVYNAFKTRLLIAQALPN